MRAKEKIAWSIFWIILFPFMVVFCIKYRVFKKVVFFNLEEINEPQQKCRN